jgi:hypothetical protein
VIPPLQFCFLDSFWTTWPSLVLASLEFGKWRRDIRWLMTDDTYSVLIQGWTRELPVSRILQSNLFRRVTTTFIDLLYFVFL